MMPIPAGPKSWRIDGYHAAPLSREGLAYNARDDDGRQCQDAESRDEGGVSSYPRTASLTPR